MNFENENKLQEVESDSEDEDTQELLNSNFGKDAKDCLDSSLSETEGSLLNTNYVDKESDDDHPPQQQPITQRQQCLTNALFNQQNDVLNNYMMNQPGFGHVQSMEQAQATDASNLADEFLGEIQ